MSLVCKGKVTTIEYHAKGDSYFTLRSCTRFKLEYPPEYTGKKEEFNIWDGADPMAAQYKPQLLAISTNKKIKVEPGQAHLLQPLSTAREEDALFKINKIKKNKRRFLSYKLESLTLGKNNE